VRRGLLKIALLAAAAGGLSVGGGLAIGGWDFLRQHAAPLVGSALALLGVAALVGRAVAGALRGAVLAVRRPRALGQSGAASAEFVIVIIPFLLMLFGLMQLSLASLARVLVSYSAFCAARAAIVVVPAPSEDGSEGAGIIGEGKNAMGDFGSSKKVALLRHAAAYPMIPASPSIDSILLDTVEHFPDYLNQRMHDGWVPFANANTSSFVGIVETVANVTARGAMSRFRQPLNDAIAGALGAAGIHERGYSVDRALDSGFGAGTDSFGGALLRSMRKLIYAEMFTVVTLYDDKGNLKSKFGWNDPIRARVTHMFYCQIPLANRFAGKNWYKAPQATLDQMATGPMGSWMTSLGIPGFFLPISAEHTLINQGAPNE
jgi:hypothetical protein